MHACMHEEAARTYLADIFGATYAYTHTPRDSYHTEEEGKALIA